MNMRFLRLSKIKRIDRLELLKKILGSISSEQVYSCFKESVKYMEKALKFEDF